MVKRDQRWGRVATAMGVAALWGSVGVVALLAGCGAGGQDAPPAAGPAPVQVVTVAPRALTLSQDLPGRVVATRVAEVRARVAGIVLRREFQEGADVKAGQVLFRIDPAPYRAALNRAQAELARTEAALADAQSVVRRYTPLAQLDAVSQQEFDAAQASFKSAQAARLAARADVETAQLNLDYTTVTAPIAGRIGRAHVTEGALVGQGEATALATIQQLHPIQADFTQPVADVLRAREAGLQGRDTRLSVSAEGSRQVREGRLVSSDASVDASSGQITLRGEFPNPDGLLLPGMYVRVRTVQAQLEKAFVLPQRAVRRGSDGQAQVLLLGADGKVQARAVQTGAMVGPDWHIASGLAGGERVIVGGPPVNPGDAATVAAPEAAAPAASAASAPARS